MYRTQQKDMYLFHLVYNAINCGSGSSCIPECIFSWGYGASLLSKNKLQHHWIFNIKKIVARPVPKQFSQDIIMPVKPSLMKAEATVDFPLNHPRLKGKTSKEAYLFLNSLFQKPWQLVFSGEGVVRTYHARKVRNKTEVWQCWFFEDINAQDPTHEMLATLILLEQEKRKREAQNTFLRGCLPPPLFKTFTSGMTKS
jgi:hypothetical protein